MINPNQSKKSQGLAELSQKEALLQERLDRLTRMEQEIKARELAIQTKEKEKKSVLLRLPPSLHNQIVEWAEEDFRSINGQIEYLLTQAVKQKYKK